MTSVDANLRSGCRLETGVYHIYIYNVERDNRLSIGVQPLKTRSVLKTHVFLVRFSNLLVQCSMFTSYEGNNCISYTFVLGVSISR